MGLEKDPSSGKTDLVSSFVYPENGEGKKVIFRRINDYIIFAMLSSSRESDSHFEVYNYGAVNIVRDRKQLSCPMEL